MHTPGILKAAISVLVLIAAWIDNNLSPLFYVLVALALIDFLLHAREIEKSYKKLTAAFMALGLPAFLASHVATDLFSPSALKVIVALLTVGYVQIVIPDLAALFKKLFPKEAPQIDAVGSMIEKEIEDKAKAQEQQGAVKQ